MDVEPELCYEGIGDRELGKREAGQRELTNTDYSNAKLGDREEPIRELSDRNDSFRRDRSTVAVLKRNVDQGPAEQRCFRLVFESESVEFRPGWKRGSAIRTCVRVL